MKPSEYIVKSNPLVAQVREMINATVAPLGFRKETTTKWIRDHGWKADKVVHVQRGTIFFINLYVVIPPEPGTEFDFTTVAFVNLPAVAGNLDTAYRWSESQKRLFSRIQRDLMNIDCWFAKLATRDQCVQYLMNSPHKNPLSNAYRYCMRYLTDSQD